MYGSECIDRNAEVTDVARMLALGSKVCFVAVTSALVGAATPVSLALIFVTSLLLPWYCVVTRCRPYKAELAGTCSGKCWIVLMKTPAMQLKWQLVLWQQSN
jgi:hypothetical protein